MGSRIRGFKHYRQQSMGKSEPRKLEPHN